jgi:hypothetical protein
MLEYQYGAHLVDWIVLAAMWAVALYMFRRIANKS